MLFFFWNECCSTFSNRFPTTSLIPTVSLQNQVLPKCTHERGEVHVTSLTDVCFAMSGIVDGACLLPRLLVPPFLRRVVFSKRGRMLFSFPPTVPHPKQSSLCRWEQVVLSRAALQSWRVSPLPLPGFAVKTSRNHSCPVISAPGAWEVPPAPYLLHSPSPGQWLPQTASCGIVPVEGHLHLLDWIVRGLPFPNI